MKASELIQALGVLQEEFGDVDIYVGPDGYIPRPVKDGDVGGYRLPMPDRNEEKWVIWIPTDGVY